MASIVTSESASVPGADVSVGADVPVADVPASVAAPPPGNIIQDATICFRLDKFLPDEVRAKLTTGTWKNTVDADSETTAWARTWIRVAMQIINVEMCHQVFDIADGIPSAINLTAPKRRGIIPYKVNGRVNGVVAVRANNFGVIYVPLGWTTAQIMDFITNVSNMLDEILKSPATKFGHDSSDSLEKILYNRPNALFPDGYRRDYHVCSATPLCSIIVRLPARKLREFVYDAKDDSMPSDSSYMTWSIVEQSREPPIPHMGRLPQNTQSFLNSIVLDQYGVFNIPDGKSVDVCLSKIHTNQITETGVMDILVIAPIGKPTALVAAGDKFRNTSVRMSQHRNVKIAQSTATTQEIVSKLIKQSWTEEQQDRSKLNYNSEYMCINCQGLVAGKCYAFKVIGAKTEQWRVMHPFCAHIAGMGTVLDSCYSEFAVIESPIKSSDLMIAFARIDNAALLMVSESHFRPQIEHAQKALLELDQFEQIDPVWARRGIVVTPNYIYADSTVITQLTFSDEIMHEINGYYGTPGLRRTIIQCFIAGISPPETEST